MKYAGYCSKGLLTKTKLPLNFCPGNAPIFLRPGGFLRDRPGKSVQNKYCATNGLNYQYCLLVPVVRGRIIQASASTRITGRSTTELPHRVRSAQVCCKMEVDFSGDCMENHLQSIYDKSSRSGRQPGGGHPSRDGPSPKIPRILHMLRQMETGWYRKK